jgi:hypothetical protein
MAAAVCPAAEWASEKPSMLVFQRPVTLRDRRLTRAGGEFEKLGASMIEALDQAYNEFEEQSARTMARTMALLRVFLCVWWARRF